MTELQALLNEVERLNQNATPAPWVADIMSSRFVWTQVEDNIIKIYTDREAADQAFISQSRELLPQLAALARQLDAQIRKITGPLPHTKQSWSYAREMCGDSQAVPYEVSERLESEVEQLRAQQSEDRKTIEGLREENGKLEGEIRTLKFLYRTQPNALQVNLTSQEEINELSADLTTLRATLERVTNHNDAVSELRFMAGHARCGFMINKRCLEALQRIAAPDEKGDSV